MRKMMILILCLILIIVLYEVVNVFQKKELQQETATQLATTITVLRPSFMSLQDVQKALKGTGLAGYEIAFLKAEQESGIGADYLVAIAFHESGYGTNTWWKYWNNCFSWGITDSGPNSEANKVKNMSKENAIVYIANSIKDLYLTKGAPYYKGETLSAIGTYYASNANWASAVIDIHAKFVKTLPEDVKAKQWIMGSRVFFGDLPPPKYYTSDYWTRPLTREELSIILYRINNK